MRGIVVLEGADSSGKSTLARHLVDRHGARYIHSTVRRDIWPWHVGAVRRAVRLSWDRLVVMDRLWLSELVYGRVFRAAPAYDVGARCLDRVLRSYGAVNVLCAPADQEKQVARWHAGRAAGKLEHFDRVRDVIRLYADLRDGNVAHGGTDYLDQLIRYQDYAERDDVLVYDLDRHEGPRGLTAFSRRLLARVADLTAPGGHNLSGRIAREHAGVLLVGEGISPRWPAALPRWPWVDDDRNLSAATWLNRAIHHLALREDRLVFTNVRDPASNRLPDLLARLPSPRVIALGGVAAARLQELGHRGALELPHPQWHRRFRYNEGPAAYADRLREMRCG